MYEARIEVTAAGPDFRVRLLEVTDVEKELARGTTGAAALTDGFADLEFDGARLNAGTLKTSYESRPALVDRITCGKYLYRLLTPGEVGTRWDALRAERQGAGDDLSTLLELHPDSWTALPWELLHDGNIHLFHDRRNPIGLRIPGGTAARSDCRWPLRMLIVIGCDPEDEGISWQEELLAIKRACFAFSLRLDLTVLSAPLTKQKVEEKIDDIRPHIFHFIGHATSGDQGTLLLNREPNRNDPWNREEIRTCLSGLEADESPRLAVINACQSAGAEGLLGNTSTADAFADIGCPAVIAMRGDILGSAACVFAGTFYGELAARGINRPDQAFCRAIRAVSVAEGLKQRVWSLPRIYFQQTAGAVFPLSGECRGFEKACKGDKKLSELRPFVDREEQRFAVYQERESWLEDPDPDDRVLLLKGDEEKVGRTWLLKALVYVAALRGHQTLFWDFKNEKHDLPRFLKMVRGDAGPARGVFHGSLAAAGVDPSHFANFDKLCDSDATSPSGGEGRYSDIIEALAQGLKETAKSRRVVLAFDHIDNFLPDPWKDNINKPLIEAAARGDLGDVRIAIAATDAQLKTYGLDSLPEAKPLEVESIPIGEFKDRVLEYCLHKLPADDQYEVILATIREVLPGIAQVRELRHKDWKLVELPEVLKGLVGL